MEKPHLPSHNNATETVDKMTPEDKLSKRQRRRLIKSAAALPVVLTLHSGAAMARSSNIMGEALSVETAVFVDPDSPKLLCVLPEGQLDTGAYDLGDPMVDPVLITEPPINPKKNYDKVVLPNMNEQLANCKKRQHPITGVNGIMISANAAFTSLAAKTGITYTTTTF